MRRRGWGLLGEPAFEGLVESFDLALGLGVAGVAVLLGDSEEGEEVFEGVLPAAEAGGVDAAVVGQGRGGVSVFLGGGEESGGDQVAGDRGVCGDAQQVAGVVIEPVEDLHVGAVGQVPMGEVGLPAFVGLCGCEASVGGPWPLAGFGVISPALCRIRLIVDVEGAGGRLARGARRWSSGRRRGRLWSAAGVAPRSGRGPAVRSLRSWSGAGVTVARLRRVRLLCSGRAVDADGDGSSRTRGLRP